MCWLGKVVAEYLQEPKREKLYEEVKKKPKPQLCSKGAWFLSKGINSLWKVLPSLLINSQAPNVWFQFKELIPLCEFKEGFWKMEHFKCLWKCKDNWKGLKVKEICYFPKSISRKDLCEWVCTCLCNTYFTFLYIWQELNELICNNHNVNGEFYLALQILQIDLKKILKIAKHNHTNMWTLKPLCTEFLWCSSVVREFPTERFEWTSCRTLPLRNEVQEPQPDLHLAGRTKHSKTVLSINKALSFQMLIFGE